MFARMRAYFANWSYRGRTKRTLAGCIELANSALLMFFHGIFPDKFAAIRAFDFAYPMLIQLVTFEHVSSFKSLLAAFNRAYVCVLTGVNCFHVS